jgi:hypothetical protein
MQPSTHRPTHVKPSARRSAVAIVLLLLGLLALPGLALGDKVDDLIKNLRSSDAKARLSAALNLGKMGDKRAITPLVGALTDADKTVRAVAAAALGKLIDGGVDATTRNGAIAALERVAKNDPDAFVRSQAQKAFDSVKALRGKPGGTSGPAVNLGGKALYVEIAPFTDASGTAAGVAPGLKKVVVASLPRDFAAAWPTGRSPTKAELAAARIPGFYISGTINKIEIKKTGGGATVKCWVSMLAATYPGADEALPSAFAFANNNKAEVDAAGSSDADIDEAKAVCIEELVKSITNERLIKAIKDKAP